MINLERTDDEVYRVMNWAQEAIDEGTKYPGASYEQGVLEALSWVIGDSDQSPDRGFEGEE